MKVKHSDLNLGKDFKTAGVSLCSCTAAPSIHRPSFTHLIISPLPFLSLGKLLSPALDLGRAPATTPPPWADMSLLPSSAPPSPSATARPPLLVQGAPCALARTGGVHPPRTPSSAASRPPRPGSLSRSRLRRRRSSSSPSFTAPRAPCPGSPSHSRTGRRRLLPPLPTLPLVTPRTSPPSTALHSRRRTPALLHGFLRYSSGFSSRSELNFGDSF